MMNPNEEIFAAQIEKALYNGLLRQMYDKRRVPVEREPAASANLTQEPPFPPAPPLVDGLGIRYHAHMEGEHDRLQAPFRAGLRCSHRMALC